MPLIPGTVQENTPHYDVVIIGAGAAGVTIARKLGAQGVRVALLEGGQYDLIPESQDLYESEMIGHPYSTTGTRMRMFGGGTNCWGGYVCAPDADTFQARDDLHVSYPGWPFPKSELDPYFKEALSIVDIDPDAPFAPSTVNPYDKFITGMRSIEMRELYWNMSPPTRFRIKYYDTVRDMDSVDVLLDHSLVDIESDADGEITAAVFTALDGSVTYRITGDRYVLSCGGIENPRLLLYFNEKNGTSYGNASGMLGQFFMEHPEMDAAQFVMTDPMYQHRVNNHAYRFFRPNREWQLREALPGAVLRLSFTHPAESDEIISELERVSNLQREDHWHGGYIMMSFEQMPVSSNKVALSDTLDSLGMPRTELHWELVPEDYRAPRAIVSRFAEMMLQHDLGRVRLFDWIRDDENRPDPLWAKHHMGTTRMGPTARTGVVDPNGLLYGTKNLYVMGSSNFPVGGYENPTVPIIMLSLRMSDYLLGTMQA